MYLQKPQVYIDQGDGPPVLLLHGLFGNLSLWQPLISALQTHFRVVVPRLPLYETELEPIHIKHLVQSLDQVVEELGLRDVTLVGHAVGGQVALLYAHRHPSVVRNLVLISSNGLMDQPVLGSDTVRDTIDFRYVQKRVKEAFFSPDGVVEELTSEIYRDVQYLPRLASIASLARSARHSSVTSFLSRFQHPVLLIWGLQDKINPPEIALHFHDLLPKGELRFIDQCGHVPMLEQPRITSDHVIQFLQHN